MPGDGQETIAVLGKTRKSHEEILRFVQDQVYTVTASEILEYHRLKISAQVYHSEQYPALTRQTALLSSCKMMCMQPSSTLSPFMTTVAAGEFFGM